MWVCSDERCMTASRFLKKRARGLLIIEKHPRVKNRVAAIKSSCKPPVASLPLVRPESQLNAFNPLYKTARLLVNDFFLLHRIFFVFGDDEFFPLRGPHDGARENRSFSRTAPTPCRKAHPRFA